MSELFGQDPVEETVTVDTDGDCYEETAVTTGADGSTTVGVDIDGDGRSELIGLDADSDGVTELTQVDIDGDGVMDLTQLDADADGDVEVINVAGSDLMLDDQGQVVELDTEAGTFPSLPDPAEGVAAPYVTEEPFVSEDPGVAEPVVEEEGSFTSEHDAPLIPQEVSPAPTEPGVLTDPGSDDVFGLPADDAARWFAQAENGLCVPASIAQVVAEFSGLEITDEAVFAQRAIEMGFLTPESDGWSGMSLEQGEALIESFGVEATVTTGGLDSLALYLDQGYDVIVGIDSSEVWEGIDDDTTPEGVVADHAVVVTGIDLERGVVILSDPGNPDAGNMEEVRISRFLDAWDDADREMLVTDNPAPGPPEMATTSAASPEEMAALGSALDLPGAPAGLVNPTAPGAVLLPVALPSPWARPQG